MDESSDLAALSFTTTTNNNNQTHLKNLNKASHKISKPITKKPSLDSHLLLSTQEQPQNQSQPPVYTINKNDFRDVVQKLTGSPAYHHPPPPPSTTTHPKPTSSRLQKIRPPPLAHVNTRPSPPLTDAAAKPFSPLPPFPPVSATAESPITAYMKYLNPNVPRSPCGLFSSSAAALLGLCPMLPMSPSFPVSPSLGWRDL